MQARPPSNVERRKQRVRPVLALAASPLGAMEDHPEDAEIRLRLRVLAGERSWGDSTFHIKMHLTSGRGVGQSFSRVAEASGRLCGIMRHSNLCQITPPQ
jgi:hypothetical protein